MIHVAPRRMPDPAPADRRGRPREDHRRGAGTPAAKPRDRPADGASAPAAATPTAPRTRPRAGRVVRPGAGARAASPRQAVAQRAPIIAARSGTQRAFGEAPDQITVGPFDAPDGVGDGSGPAGGLPARALRSA